MQPKIQVALDIINLEKAIQVASDVADYVDFIEAGTPLVKVEGLKSVNILKKKFSDKMIVADLKTMDTGYLESSLAYKYKADFSTVMGVADMGTIKGAIKARDEFDRGIMVDLMNLHDSEKIKEISLLKPDYLIVHSGIDMQNRGLKPFDTVRILLDMKLPVKISVAGGLDNKNILNLKDLDIGLLIVGGYITKAEDPRHAAREFFNTVNNLF